MRATVQQLGDDRFVLVRALAQVDRREVKAEHLHGAHQRRQARRDQRLGVMVRRSEASMVRRSASSSSASRYGSCGATAWRSASVPVRLCSVAASRA